MSTSTLSQRGGRLDVAAGQVVDRQRTLDQGSRRGGRLPEWRRPAGAPRGNSGTGARVSTAGHHGQAAPALSNTWVVVIAMAVLLTVGGTAYQVRGMGVIDTSTSISVVEVLPGDTLGSIAARNAPGLAVADVVRQIRALNDIPSAQVRAGQSLRVPVTAGR